MHHSLWSSLLIAYLARCGLAAATVDTVVRPTLSCPKDYRQTGKVCLKVEYADFQYACPKGAQLEDARGVDGVPTCVAFEQVPATLTCPDGYIPGRDKKCERANRFPARVECDDKYSFTNGQCIRNILYETTLVCPKGHKLEGTQCMLHHKQPLIPSCSPGSELSYDQDKPYCRRTEVVAPQVLCPTGYTRPHELLSANNIDVGRLTEGNIECIRTDVQPVELTCQKGFKLDGGQCIRSVDTGKPDILCETGVLNGKKCEVVDSAPPSLVCKKGFTMEGDRCVRLIEQPPQFICEKGWKLSDHVGTPKCERVITVDSELRCPEGSVIQGKKCVSVETGPLVPNCKKGFEEKDGHCVRRHAKRPEVVCPDNFELSHDKCVLVTISSPEQGCPPGTNRKGHHCESVSTTAPKPTCKKGRLDGFQCVESSTRAPRAFCPKNYTLEKDQCLAFDYIKPERVCPKGVPHGDKCEIPVRVDALQSCPKGFVVGISGRCQRAHATDARHTCPAGTKLVDGICQEKKLR